LQNGPGITAFSRHVTRYSGDKDTRTLSWAKQFLAVIFAQPVCRESLLDIVTLPSASLCTLYKM
jgi:hypothetical protein